MPPVTSNGYMGTFSALMDFAVNEHLIDRNPAAGLRRPAPRRSPEDRFPFTVEELAHIFAAPLYTGCQDDGAGYAVPGSNRPRRARSPTPARSKQCAASARTGDLPGSASPGILPSGRGWNSTSSAAQAEWEPLATLPV